MIFVRRDIDARVPAYQPLAEPHFTAGATFERGRSGCEGALVQTGRPPRRHSAQALTGRLGSVRGGSLGCGGCCAELSSFCKRRCPGHSDLQRHVVEGVQQSQDPEPQLCVASPLGDAAQVPQHALQDQRLRRRNQRTLRQRHRPAGKALIDPFAAGFVKGDAAVKRVEKEVAASGQEMARHADAFNADAAPTTNVDEKDGERDRDAQASVEHLGKHRVFRVVIVTLVAGETPASEQLVTEGLGVVTAARRSQRRQASQLEVDVSLGIDRRRDQERGLGQPITCWLGCADKFAESAALTIHDAKRRLRRIRLARPPQLVLLATTIIRERLRAPGSPTRCSQTKYRRAVGTRFPFLGSEPAGRGPVLAIAHRGGTLRHPENTLDAFQDSVDLGYRHIETDVHASADGHLYAFHDDHLGRIVGVHAYIGDLTSTELDSIRFNGNYRIPRLDEVLSTWPQLRVNIDPKADAAVEPLVRTVDRHDAVDRVCIGSFSGRRIRYCQRELGPALCTSMGPREVVRLALHARGFPTRDFTAAAAQIPLTYKLGGRRIDLATKQFIDAAHDRGVHVHVWTVDDEPTMHRLLDIGVDGIMTDRPDVLRSVMITRGRWEAARV